MIKKKFGPDTTMDKYEAGFVTAGGTMFYFFLRDILLEETDFEAKEIALKKACIVESHLITFMSQQGPGAQFINRVRELENIKVSYDADGFVNNDSDVLKSMNEIESGIKSIG